MTTFVYMAGLPRSGSTVFSSVLNQNPDIFASSSSPICNMLWESQVLWRAQLALHATPNDDAITRCMRLIIPTFYADRKEKVIIDKAFMWGHPLNVEMLDKYAPSKPKFIVMQRNPDEALNSLTRLTMSNPHNQFDKDFVGNYTYEAVKQYISRPNTVYTNCLWALNNLLSTRPEDCCIINYERLITNADDVLDEFYDFMQLPRFEHDLNNIENSFTGDDLVWGIPGMHKIKPTLPGKKSI